MSALGAALRELPDAVFADVLESDDAYLLVLDLPGVTAETLEVTADRGRLTVEARRRKSVPDEFDYVREDRSMFLDVELPLPPGVTGADARGTLDRGVLELYLPKSSTAPGTTIAIEDA